MVETFEENLGRIPYVTLDQVKDYLSISSNTHDARLSNIVFYATSIIEHYIGQEVVAQDYIEIFNGGSPSVFVSRLPLNNVYYVSEFNGVDHELLADPSTIGTSVSLSGSSSTIIFNNNAKLTTRVKNFGLSSLQLGEDDYLATTPVPEKLQFRESDFTIEAFVRVDENIIQDNVVFKIESDSANYMQFALANQYGLSFTSVIDGNTTTITGANTSIESQIFTRKKWHHIAVSKHSEQERLYLHFNGITVANSAYSILEHDFKTTIEIGTTFKGYIDECRVSTIARYNKDFNVPIHRFRTDQDTVFLLHFDGKDGSTNTSDSHDAVPEYSFARDSGEITRDVGAVGVGSRFTRSSRSYPSMSLAGLPTFKPYPSGIKVSYRAGYEADRVPYDLQVATLDYVKMLYKQDQERQGFTFEGERGASFNLSGNFPPHIRRVLDLYRIIN